MATPAQLEANRRNALLSTGPRSAQGKESSRRNAVKHGLAAETLILPDDEAEAVAARIARWSPGFGPRNAEEHWLVEEFAVCTVRIERCRDRETALRTRSARRASTCWDADRAAMAEDLGARLAKAPSIVVHKLRTSKPGCDWLIARWEGLGRALESKGGWNESQKNLALDLLGTPAEFRDVPNPLLDDRPALVAAEVARLEALKAEAMDELDDLDRAAAEVGLGDDLDKPLTLVHRYEAACVRRMERAKRLLQQNRPALAKPATPRVETPADPGAPVLEAAVSPVGRREREPAAVPPQPPQSQPAGNRRSRRAAKARARRS